MEHMSEEVKCSNDFYRKQTRVSPLRTRRASGPRTWGTPRAAPPPRSTRCRVGARRRGAHAARTAIAATSASPERATLYTVFKRALDTECTYSHSIECAKVSKRNEVHCTVCSIKAGFRDVSLGSHGWISTVGWSKDALVLGTEAYFWTRYRLHAPCSCICQTARTSPATSASRVRTPRHPWCSRHRRPRSRPAPESARLRCAHSRRGPGASLGPRCARRCACAPRAAGGPCARAACHPTSERGAQRGIRVSMACGLIFLNQ